MMCREYVVKSMVRDVGPRIQGITEDLVKEMIAEK